MATKHRIGMRCYNPYVPNEVWALFKKELRKIIQMAFPDQKLSATEFYWQGFSFADEYIRIIPKDDKKVDWKKMWDVLQFVANEFGMKIDFIYQEVPVFHALREDDGFERKYSSYSLVNVRTWNTEELDSFLESYSTETLKEKYTKMFRTATSGLND